MKEAGTVIVFLVSSSISSFRVITLEGEKERRDQERRGREASNQGSVHGIKPTLPCVNEFQSSQILTLLRSCCSFLSCLVCM